jgi:Kef-type K+ transport system membrane component KefB
VNGAIRSSRASIERDPTKLAAKRSPAWGFAGYRRREEGRQSCLSGILLGPSLPGWSSPGLSAALFPLASLGVLEAPSQLGLLLFVFMIGLELNLGQGQHQGKVALLISHASIATPMAVGAILAVYLYPLLSDGGVAFGSFALFLGAGFSITAFPVLARILRDRNLLGTHLGTMAIACAAIDDVTGWCVPACIVAQVRAGHVATSIWTTIAVSVRFWP